MQTNDRWCCVFLFDARGGARVLQFAIDVVVFFYSREGSMVQ